MVPGEHALMPRNHPALLQSCILDCLECYTLCRQAAAEHTAARGAPLDIEDRRMLDDCAEATRMAADFLLRGSPHHGEVCALCTVVCKDCAETCEALGLQACAEACRACARSCASIAAAAEPVIR
jgi:hypothetical protein